MALPDIETLVAMARLFGITVDMLLNPEKLNRPAPEAYSDSSISEPAADEPEEDEDDEEDLEEEDLKEEDEEKAPYEEQSDYEETIDLNNLGDYISEQIRTHMPNFNGNSFKFTSFRGRKGKIPHMPHMPNIPPIPKAPKYGGHSGRSVTIHINTPPQNEQSTIHILKACG